MTIFLLFSFITLTASDIYYCDISLGPVLVKPGLLICNNSISTAITTTPEIIVQGSSTTNSIVSTGIDSKIHLKSVTLNSESAVSINGGNVNFIFEGTNNINSGDNAGIKCVNNASIYFSNATSNSGNCILNVKSNSYSGIGVDYELSNCKALTFAGGQITSIGGIHGAGIGGALGSESHTGNVELIKIISGTITATGGRYASGIGGGRGQSENSAKVETLEIYGGTIKATGGEYGAGIGGGFGHAKNSGFVNKIGIFGGEIVANGGIDGAGIGGGYGFGNNGNSAYVNQIILSSNTKPEHSTTSTNSAICVNIVANGGSSSQKGIGGGIYGKVTNIQEEGSSMSCNNKYCEFKSSSSCMKPWQCSSDSLSDCPTCESSYQFVNGECVQSCGDIHCIEYSSECFCSKCEAGYLVNDGKCEACNNPNCLSFSSECICSQCDAGFILAYGKCSSCSVDHCSSYSEGCTCSKCNGGYSALNGICSQCTNLHCLVYSDECFCSQCSAGYNLINGQCQECNVQYCSSYSTGCICSSCEAGYKLSNGICNSCLVQNCFEYSASGECQCSKCSPGFQVSDGLCASCSSSDHCNEYQEQCYCGKCENDYNLIAGKCTKCNIEHCSIFDEDCSCKECSSGYVLLANGKCEECGIVHCSGYSQGCTCNKCDAGYNLSNEGKCLSCNNPHCTSFSEGCTCHQCSIGYSVDNGLCQLCTDPNCITYKENCFCSECKAGFHSSSDGKCIVCETHCELYSSQCLCASCIPGYQLEGEICTGCDFPHCFEYSQGCTCMTCDVGFFLNNGKCYECGLVHCNSYSNKCECSSCEAGYHLNSEKKCSACSTQHCLSFSNECNCGKCRPGFHPNLNGTCDFCNVTECLVYSEECSCQSCLAGFYESYGKCNQCIGYNCRNFTSGCSCSDCEPGFILNGEKCLTCGDPNCIHFDEGCHCSLCQPGFSFSNTSTIANSNKITNSLSDHLHSSSSGSTANLIEKCLVCPNKECSRFSTECQCESCNEKYSLFENNCYSCTLQNCLLCNNESKCIQCETGFAVIDGTCNQCPDSHCTSFINGCECTHCETGFKLSNKVCHSCDIEHCVEYQENCVCKSCEYGYKSLNGRCYQIPDDYMKVSAIFYCATDDKTEQCDYYTNNWESYGNQLINNMNLIISEKDDSSLPYERSRYAAYKLLIENIRKVVNPINAKGDINNAMKNINKKNSQNNGKVITSAKLLIFQFGTMSSSQYYDFSKLPKNYDVQVVSMDCIVYNFASSMFVIKSGNQKKLNSLSLYLGKLQIKDSDKTFKVSNIELIGTTVSNSKIKIESDNLVIDSYSLSSLVQIDSKVSNFGVFIPEKSNWNIISMYRQNNKNEIVIQPGIQPLITISTKIGEKQTSIICFSTDIVLQLKENEENSLSAKSQINLLGNSNADEISTVLNVSVHNDGNYTQFEFNGEHWNETKLENGIIFEADSKDDLKIYNSAKSGTITVNDRYDDSQAWINRKKGLSGGAIAAIVICVLVAISVGVACLIYFLCIRKKKENKDESNQAPQKYLDEDGEAHPIFNSVE